MAQAVDLDSSIGYALKQVTAALRAGMEAALSPLDLTVSQYSCLELLAQHPGMSGAELARGVFVTRQSMQSLVLGLQRRGLLERPATAPHGRALPSELTPAGRDLVQAASQAVGAVEQRMLHGLDDGRRHRLLTDLRSCRDELARPVS